MIPSGNFFDGGGLFEDAFRAFFQQTSRLYLDGLKERTGNKLSCFV
jgi:hypothetical protein